ncbi:MAG: class I SAM-dependent methyltransferase [candidate division WOR-3 bacterium]
MYAPFTRFARFYDRFMQRYVDYPDWVNYVLKIFRRFKVEPKTILDLACGTGIPTVILAEQGFRVIGVDRSKEMLAILLDKKGDLPIEVLCADIRDFTLDQPVDAAICLYDSINYLLTEQDLERCFHCVAKALVPSGLFVFDMNTVYGLERHWGTRTVTRETPELVSIWQSRYDHETRISQLHLVFWEKMADGSLGEKHEEVHEERAYTQKEVRQALKSAGFDEIHFYHHGGFLPVGPLTTRMMVVAKKRL